MKVGVIKKVLVKKGGGEFSSVRPEYLVLSRRFVSGNKTCLTISINQTSRIFKNFENHEEELAIKTFEEIAASYKKA